MMEPIWWMITGLVFGGLSLWLVMRERVFELEAQLESHTRRESQASYEPPVKTRDVGSGSSRVGSSVAEQPAKSDPAPPPADKESDPQSDAIVSEEPANDADDVEEEE